MAAFAATAVNAPIASANAGCGKHITFINGWSTDLDTISTGFDFQCGGSISDYRLRFDLQWFDGTNGWIHAGCGSGSNYCTVYRPSPMGTFYIAGTEHGNYPNSDWTWNVVSPAHIANHQFRVLTTVTFYNGDPDLRYYSSSVTI